MRSQQNFPRRTAHWRLRFVVLCVVVSFFLVGLQLLRLAAEGSKTTGVRVSMLTPASGISLARPDILDRKDRLLATDVLMPSLYADPSLIQDKDEAAEQIIQIFPQKELKELRRSLSDPARRFVWIKRHLSPSLAQKVHNIGLPGLSFIDEIKRTYPTNRLGGHILGRVDIDNRGIAGIERFIDKIGYSEPTYAAHISSKAPVRLSLDLAVMHAVEEELENAIKKYEAVGAGGLVLDARSGEVLAAVSLPGVDPSEAEESLNPARIDKVISGVYELGSVMKLLTVALALEDGKTLDSFVDTSQPLSIGQVTIRDPHPLGRPMTLSEVFLHSSNLGAALLALSSGPDRQKALLQKLGLWTALRTEVGPGPEPLRPTPYGRLEQITISYGHGLGVTPLQFASAAASLLNGGIRITPTFLRQEDNSFNKQTEDRVISEKTSHLLRQLMRLNVIDQAGTGRAADVKGYRVGGKTGTAEIAVGGAYQKKSVIASFIGAFPAEAPRYITLVMLFEPKGQDFTAGEITAGHNAAPTTARIIERIAPLLGMIPNSAETG
ncbi:MAG: peptidoglycan D,D-transpeptidase FtsI family protein [Hyphomicrobium sp.]